MKRLLILSLAMIPYAHAMELVKAQETPTILESIKNALGNEFAQQARVQESPAELASFFEQLKTLNTFFETLSSYTPFNAAASEQWQSLKNPLVCLAKSNLVCRNAASEGLSKIRCLGITTRQSSELMKASKGSDRALAIGRELIPKAVQELRDDLAKVKALEKPVGILHNISYILELMKFNNPALNEAIAQMLPLQRELMADTNQLKELLISLNAQKEEVFFWTNCMHVFDAKMHGDKEAYRATKERYAENNGATALPAPIEQSVQALFPQRAQYPVKNGEVEIQRNYLDAVGILIERSSKQNGPEDRLAKEIHQALFDQVSQLRSASLLALKKTKDASSSQASELLARIESVQAKLDALQNPFKENASALLVIKALLAAQNLCEQNHYAQPLVTMLECVERLVSPCLAMLSSDDKTMQFLSDRTLNKHVGLLFAIATQGNTAIADVNRKE